MEIHLKWFHIKGIWKYLSQNIGIKFSNNLPFEISIFQLIFTPKNSLMKFDWKELKLTKENLYCRFHSFYPWHTGGDYNYLCKEEDNETKKWVLLFKWVLIKANYFNRSSRSLIFNFDSSRYDLYTKSSTIPDLDKLWPYYQSLINKYIPGILYW